MPNRIEIPAKLGGRRLDEILAELYPEHSRAALQKLVRRGRVRLDGKRVLRSNVRPRARGVVELELEAEAPQAAAERLHVLHEDEHLIAIDKPAGLLTHGNDRSEEDSLAELAVRRFGPLPMTMGEHRPGVVHRLDRQTSGVILLARSEAAMETLREMFRRREVTKVYYALVHGSPAEDRFRLDWDIGPRDENGNRMTHRRRGQGQSATTDIEVIEHLGDFAAVRCLPGAGRRHQIRVHLHAAGFPIVADELYRMRGAGAPPTGAPVLRRQALHARRLQLAHPITEIPMELEAKLPADIAGLSDWLREHAPQR